MLLTLINQTVADVYGTSIDQLIGKSGRVIDSGGPVVLTEECITN